MDDEVPVGLDGPRKRCTHERFLPMCAGCQRIRGESGDWRSLDASVPKPDEAVVTHTLCPDCVQRLYPEIASRVLGLA